MSGLSVTANQISLEDIRAALDEFAIKVQDRACKRALREFAEHQKPILRSKNRGLLNPSHIKYRVKVWPSGVVWMGLGYYEPPGNFGDDDVRGRARRRAYDAAGVGWRSHFTELGFHTWPKDAARPASAVGRGWKRKLRHRNRGTYHRGTQASRFTLQATSPRIRDYLMREIEFLRMQRTKGRNARRSRIT